MTIEEKVKVILHEEIIKWLRKKRKFKGFKKEEVSDVIARIVEEKWTEETSMELVIVEECTGLGKIRRQS